MNEENKYKLIFGMKVPQKEFFNLQNESKLMKPASLNTILGKRHWKLKDLPLIEKAEGLLLNQRVKKNKKLATSDSFSDGMMPTEALTQENTLQSSTKCLENANKGSRGNNINFELEDQISLAKNYTDHVSAEDFFESCMAYNLRKKAVFPF